MSTKRLAKALAVIAVGSLALTACGGAGNSEKDKARTHAMYTWYSSGADKAQWDAYVAAAKAADKDFKLDLSGVAITDFYTKASTRMQQSDAPCLLTTQAERAQGLSGNLAPITEPAKAAGIDLGQYNKGMLEGLTIGGELKGIPLDAAPSVVYYNKKAFKEAGIPEPTLNWTRAQFLEAAKKVTQSGKYGLGLDVSLTTTLFYTFGNGSVPVVDGKLKLDDPKFVADVQWVFDLAAKQKVAAAPGPNNLLNVSQQNFQSGKIAMYADGPWMYAAHSKALGKDLGMAVPPSDSGTPTGIVRGTAVGIAKNCPDKEGAAKVLKTFASADVLGKIAADRGQVPAIASVVDKWSSTKSPQAKDVVSKLLENSKPLLTTKSWDQVVSLYLQYAPEGFSGAKSAQEILAKIQSQAGGK